MNAKILKVVQIFFAINFIIVGIDKFYAFLPKCSLVDHVSETVWIAIGVIEIIMGIFILLNKYNNITLPASLGSKCNPDTCAVW